MSKPFRFGATAALLACISLPALADGSPDTASANLGDITVTATRTPLIADQEVAPVIVITPQQLQLAAGGNIGDVLRQYAGLDIAQSGGPGQPESLFLRGTNSNHTLVMIDGVKINPDNGFGSALQNIRLADVERIEIVKGPRASLYGSDAIGGVINIITRKPADGVGCGVHAGAGRYGTYDNGGDFSYGDGVNAFGVSADNYHTDGFPAVANTTFNAGNQDRTVTAFGRTSVADVDVALNHWQSKGYTQYVGTDASFAPVPADEDFQDATTSLDFTAHPVHDWRSNLNFSHMLDEIDQRQLDPFAFPGPAVDFVHTQRNVVDWQNDLALGDNQLLTAGLYTETEATGFYSFGAGQPEQHRVNAIYAEDNLDFDTQRLVLAGRDTRDQSFGDHFTWNVDYGYDLSNSTKLTAGAGTGFRAPTADELHDAFSGNTALKPETSQNLELGVRRKFGEGQTFTASVFRDNLDDLIVFDPTPTPGHIYGQNQNVGRARVEGLELGYLLSGTAWSWRNDAILQNPEDLDKGAYLLRRARRSFTTELSWHAGVTSAGVNLLLMGPRSDIDFKSGAPVTDGGYALLGVSLRREIGAGFAVLLRMDNLLDTHYQTANGYNTAGRSLFVSLSYASR